jgi:nucleoside-diphosphate-sugar epimerase
VLEAVAQHGSRILFASTLDAYGPTRHLGPPRRADDPMTATDAHSEHKIHCEELVHRDDATLAIRVVLPLVRPLVHRQILKLSPHL